MTETTVTRDDPMRGVDVPPPGAVAWLDVSGADPDGAGGRPRTGPLGMQIAPLRGARGPFFFTGGRLRGMRCIWSASTVCGADLYRPARTPGTAPFEGSVHLLARAEGGGSVFDPVGISAGTLHVFEASDEICEQFSVNTHLFTLNVPRAAMGADAAAVRDLRGRGLELTPFQSQLLRAAAGLLRVGGDELTTPSRLVGVDHHLASLAALLLRTAVQQPEHDLERAERVRLRAAAIIVAQAGDPSLTPAAVATQLNISLRQLYRAFDGTESPAARIRRRRLENAAEILIVRDGPRQVERVATECGFASAEYFSRAFRREYGLSPRAFRSARRLATVGAVGAVGAAR